MPQELSMLPRSVAGIAIASDGRLFVAKRKAGGAIGLKWEFPGGKLEAGEGDKEALRREFLEEFGIIVEPLKLIGCTRFYCENGERELAAWQVRIVPGREPVLHEHSEFAWLSMEKIRTIDLADSDKGVLELLRAI